jgi:hypothetical protein
MKELARLSKYDLTKATGCGLTVNGGYLHIAAYYPNKHSGIFDAVLVVVLTFAVIGASCRRGFLLSSNIPLAVRKPVAIIDR